MVLKRPKATTLWSARDIRRAIAHEPPRHVSEIVSREQLSDLCGQLEKLLEGMVFIARYAEACSQDNTPLNTQRFEQIAKAARDRMELKNDV